MADSGDVKLVGFTSELASLLDGLDAGDASGVELAESVTMPLLDKADDASSDAPGSTGLESEDE